MLAKIKSRHVAKNTNERWYKSDIINTINKGRNEYYKLRKKFTDNSYVKNQVK